MYENCSINQFKRARFKDDYSEFNKEELKIIETEYIDTAGLYETEEFNKVKYIHYLNNRVNSVKLAIKLQSKFLEEFGIPYIPDLSFFNKFGHSIYWNESKELFLNALSKIEKKEFKYISQIETNMKQLHDLRAKKNKGEVTLNQSYKAFTRTLISLRKMDYKIDDDKTMMDELAMIIKMQSEEAKLK